MGPMMTKKENLRKSRRRGDFLVIKPSQFTLALDGEKLFCFHLLRNNSPREPSFSSIISINAIGQEPSLHSLVLKLKKYMET
jgi:hypothetical protein